VGGNVWKDDHFLSLTYWAILVGPL